MGLYKTDSCFFTKIEVISCDETDGKQLDGYYYRIMFNDKVREIRLSHNDDWENDKWIKNYGNDFLNLIDEKERGSFFQYAKTLDEVKVYFNAINIK
ncbi:MAG: hypothetical protein PHS84_00190 [Paludibacter sp.]|jgi:hypothetical protein|nr:hypothetical protein [Paludibacter sp.]